MYFPVSALLIEYMILSVVESRDSYGYEISQTVKKAADIKESTLYPILKKLEGNSFLSHIEEVTKCRISDYLFAGVSGKKEKILFPYRRRQGTDCISEQ